MSFDAMYHPYPSRRTTVFARRGMVATSHPLAAQAGLEVLQRGGNAIDAAIATAAALTVVEPTSNGIGGDAFAIVWSGGRLHGLNSSGPAPQHLTIDAVRAAGHDEMPRFGWLPVTVPGAPAAWAALSERFGRLPLSEVLAPAVRLAEEGHPVSPVAAHYWQIAHRRYAELEGEAFRPWMDTFAPDGRAPQAGELWASPGHARTLRLIGQTRAEAFYRGELADEVDAFARRTGGLLRKEDLAAFRPEWVDPVSVSYRGYEVWELPPNGQGIIALMALNILNGFEFSAKDDVETVHRQIEALKLAFADGKQYITDPRFMPVHVEQLLSPAYAQARRELIGRQALDPVPGRPDRGGTVYLATADQDGNLVSFIQSNYMGFGSGIVVPGTGISLQNRGHTFSLDPSHVNALAPGKRTYHTIIPGFLTRGGEPVGPFGVMGGYMQPQGHLQVVMNLIDFHLNPQAALDAPRWQWTEGRKVVVEREFPAHIAQALARRGHEIQVANDAGGFGRGQVIWRLANGVLAGGTEPRTDGTIACW
ncbi:gamma-glutamyltransferase family protein [Alicyclobacillus sp.]|uniref:gamma-glutamyltransferase family protein n=1 Tax=Alicyclobacillus sp. TaxID=61169 RepID=UPI0025BB2C26|nr:gamma-glutamyltransferase family protein [Alicyclobacillus sp.]MCL6517546.1 gamma-glutamyltransferase family protein [Alicyclobacillus sp.]